MSVARIAGRYAKSLIDLAQEQGSLEAVNNDMILFSEVAKNNDFAAMLKSPIINADKKQNVFNAIFDGKVSVITSSFIKILLLKGREVFLKDIAKEFIAQYQELNKVSSVRLVTASPLSAATVAAIQAKLEADVALHDNITLETAVDADLIGGFVLEFNDKRYDSSISYQLQRLHKEFRTNLYVDQV